MVMVVLALPVTAGANAMAQIGQLVSILCFALGVAGPATLDRVRFTVRSQHANVNECLLGSQTT
jgi:hypothetical protein